MIDRGTIWVAALEDLGARCSVDTKLDAEYVQRRIATEGESFLTNTLPQFGKDFERALEELAVSHTMFPGFARRTRPTGPSHARVNVKGGLPKFLSGFTSIVFDDAIDVTREELNELRGVVEGINRRRRLSPDYGDANANPPIYLEDLLVPIARPKSGTDDEHEARMADAIAAIRQLCLMFGKEKSVCSPDLVERAVEEFKRTDEELIDPFSTEE